MLILLRRLGLLLFWVCLGIPFLWGMGFIIFVTTLSLMSLPSSPYEQTDALIVLTGGRDRIQTGLSLLHQKASPLLFISGVKENVTQEEILSQNLSPTDLPFKATESPIFLGHHARNTRDNAKEVALWLQRSPSSVKSVRLITSVYHIPRSLLEFRQALPFVHIISHPVFSEAFQEKRWWLTEHGIKLCFSEYFKYNLALIRIASEKIKKRVSSLKF